MQHLKHQLLMAFGIVLVASLLITLTIRAFLPNDEKIIDQAIKNRDPSLCEKVKKLTKPGFGDKAVTVEGPEAVEECKNFVELGTQLR